MREKTAPESQVLNVVSAKTRCATMTPTSSNDYARLVSEAAAFIAARMPAKPGVAVTLGTGLGGFGNAIAGPVFIPYAEIPHFPVSTVASHEGRLIAGTCAGVPILAMQGRFHLYEGYTPQQVTFPVRVFAALGIKTLILTNAAGGLNPAYAAGDIMLITDHINFLGANPLTGPNHDAWGPRFPDMTEPYSRRLQGVARAAAEAEGLALRQGVYVAVPGPSLETAAETRFLRGAGADAVGMSTVLEDIAAVHAGLQVLGLSVISNVNNPDNYQPATLADIVATCEQAGDRLSRLLLRALRLHVAPA